MIGKYDRIPALEGNIFITGGAGTLGRAIVRKALEEDWNCRFTIYSRSEFLQAQMRSLYPKCNYVLGDVADYERLQAAMAGHNLVIHAAAMKRIPECEEQPFACYRTNIQGSINVARAVRVNGVPRCVGISTDKACLPITAYGASKLAMEKLFQKEGEDGVYPIFTLVRYGNVVASRGSVIPLWQKQHALGQPLTITSSSATRFWMSQSQAVELVQRAAHFEQRGVIVVPKMKSLSISALAEIICPNSEKQEIGFRSIEKLHEDLVHIQEPSIYRTGYYYILPYYPTYDGTIYPSHYHNSLEAESLTKEEFMNMLEEAKRYE